MALVLTSLLTFGLGGLVFWAVNGYAFGNMIATLPPDKIPGLLLYAPLEVSAFLLGSAAAHRLSMALVSWLRWGRSPRPALRKSVLLFGVGAGAIVLSAFLEAWAIRLAWGR